MSEDEPYRVGKGRPPLHTQFQKGICPNPRGRPKGSRNLASIVMKSLDEKIVVTSNGRRRKVSKLEAAATQIANKAAGGDLKAIQLAFELHGEAEAKLALQADGGRSRAARRDADASILALLKSGLRPTNNETAEEEDEDG